MKIAIVEDEQEHAQLLERYLQNWAAQSREVLQTKVFSNADAFLFDWEENKDYTAIFLDIQMPKMNGMELAKRIRRDSETAQLIFTTGISDYMQQGYEVAALHYLLKPLQEQQVYSCMERISRLTVKKEDWILLHGENSVERVRIGQIWWAEAVGHSALVGIARKKEDPLTRLEVSDSFGCLEEQLSSQNTKSAADRTEGENGQFIKCHRSYLVNLLHVSRMEKTEVILDNGDRIPLSRRMYKQVNEAFIRFYQRGFETK